MHHNPAVIDQHQWQNIRRPGYLGKQRDQMQQDWDELYGVGNWQLAWQCGTECITLAAALSIYEDGYFEFFTQNPGILIELVQTASDVYDDAPSNVSSGLDYSHQETSLNHWHDIAIRRAVLRHGMWFAGATLAHIRHEQSKHPLSMVLSPGQVPFHKPSLILQPELTRWWWDTGSIESFYQSNKVLLVQR